MDPLLDLTPGVVTALACSLEVAAPKVGNVHRTAEFDDGVFEDFLVSGILMGQTIDAMAELSIGETILQVVRQTKHYVGHNTNLGLALLLVPLAKATLIIPTDPALNSDRLAGLKRPLQELLDDLTIADSVAIYQAIDSANPGGLNRVERGDVQVELNRPDPMPLMEAMTLAADWDLIAKQYTNCFEQVLVDGLELLQQSLRRFTRLPQAIVHLQLSLLSRFGDSLIERKCGMEVNRQVRTRATRALDQIEDIIDRQPESRDRIEVIIDQFDDWLRDDGHRRNPGTTADLIGAILYVAIVTGTLKPPFR